jgi:hypothetical protein
MNLLESISDLAAFSLLYFVYGTCSPRCDNTHLFTGAIGAA